MYDIKIIKDQDYYQTYCFKTKNEYGQILHLEIFSSDWNYLRSADTYAVKFFITSKRKNGYQFLTQTGKDGIKSLAWAKKCIIYFLQNIINDRDKIIIFADNKKRMKIYEFGLTPIGFKPVRLNGERCLMYKAV